MKKPITMLLVLLGAACGGTGNGERGRVATADGAQDTGRTAGMPGMEGMPGMAMGDGPIRITARQAALAGVTYAVAREAPLTRTVRAVAMAVPNERGLGIVNARVSGWVEKLHADETGRLVKAGEPLLELYAPELVTAQEELLLAKGLPSTAGGDSLLAAARRRLALWGISDEEIAAIEQGGARRHLTIHSPYPGHILEKHVIDGQMVQAGDRLFKIADLTTIWIEPAIFEQDIPLVRVGQRADVTFDALPGHLFTGRVTFSHPELDMRTRTLKVRVEVPNRRLLIKPMMYGAVRIVSNGPRGVTVPAGAILPTGTRDLAFVVRQGGVVPTDVVIGSRGDSTILIVDGLAVGDTVVSSATFLFDSESQLAAAMAGIMLNMGMGLEMGGMPMGETTGEGEAGRGKGDTTMPGMRMPRERRP